jgi:hypothetical protein
LAGVVVTADASALTGAADGYLVLTTNTRNLLGCPHPRAVSTHFADDNPLL